MKHMYSSRGFAHLSLIIIVVLVAAGIGVTGYAVAQRYQMQLSTAKNLSIAATSADLSGTNGAQVSVTDATPVASSSTSTSSATSNSSGASSTANSTATPNTGSGASASTPSTAKPAAPPVSVEPVPSTLPGTKLYPISGTFTQGTSVKPIPNHKVDIYQIIRPVCTGRMACPNYIAVAFYATAVTNSSGYFTANVPIGNYEVRLDPNVCNELQNWYFTENGTYNLVLSFNATCSASTVAPL